MTIAYLLSQYPAVNHVFMLREIRFLRADGFDIRAISLRRPDRDFSALTGAERDEARSTYYVLGAKPVEVLRAHWATFRRRPGAYFSGLWASLRSPVSFLSALFYFAEAVMVGDWMRRNGAAHLHSHFSSTIALLVARIFPVTMSSTFHGPAEFQDPAGFQLAEKVKASAFSCVISKFGRSQLMYATPYSEWSKLEVTPLGIDPAEFHPRPFRANPPRFQIITVGRLAPVKGHHVLLAAASILRREGLDFRMLFAGDGPSRRELERDVAARGLGGHVVFAGNVNQDELRELYRESDAMVLPSFGEGLPVVLMEAMAMEIPCVSTWVAGVPELINHEFNGLLVPPGDADALARAMARLITDPTLRLRLGERGRKSVLSDFDIHANGRRLAEVFRRRLAAPSTALPVSADPVLQ